MSTIKSENWDMDWLMPEAPARKRVSGSTSSSSATSSANSGARRTPSTSPESAIVVKKEEEDVSPEPRPSGSKNRRPAPAPHDHANDKEQLQRHVKAKRSQSPSVAIKFEPDSDEEDKLKVLHEEKAEFKWPRPAAMEGVNLFRLEDLDERGAPFVVPPGSELDAGLQRMLNQADGDFKRCDLPGPQQETNWSTESTRPAHHIFNRATYNSNGNLACRAPRQAILAVEGVDEAEVYSKLAVWVLLRPQATNVVNGEKWFPFGEPRRDGWQKHEEVLKAHTFYAKGTLTEYGRWMYENTLIEKRKGPAEIGVQAPPKNAMEKQEIHAATRFCLSRNRGLNVGYTVYVYDGPITEEEIGDAVERRALRRKAEELGMWNTPGKKLWLFTEEELGDSEEKAWVLREAIRLEMVGDKKQSEEGIDPTQPGQPKKAKAKKSKAGKKKSTAGKKKVAGRGGNPVSPRRRSTTPQAPAQRAERARRSTGTVYYGEDNVEEDDAGESDESGDAEELTDEGGSDWGDGTEYEDDGDD